MPSPQTDAESTLELLPSACWVLRADLTVDFQNRVADELLRAPDSWCRRANGHLHYLGSADAATIRSWVRTAAAGASLARLVAHQAMRDGGLHRGHAHVLPAHAVPLYCAAWPHAAAIVILTVESQDDEPWIFEKIGPHFAFTPAECRVLTLLAAGNPLPRIAATLSVNQTTVRTHLRSLRGKTGRRTQVDLVRLCLGR